MPILHIVLFTFKPDISTTAQQKILQEFLTLPQKCKDSSQNTYIKSIRGGVECSPISSNEYTHVFIVEFDSLPQREYYKTVDPVHLDFAERIMPMVNFARISVFEESNFRGSEEDV
ncbi:hypothetical protein ASPCADRAFT_7529 [Aspergillus carbonarius ITEM 5010]|uniref:Stress-response A/B barrel domain-containing protein n=1 Tax=Aspergillus carbonarius (strain ITEM 5010) TaxID=602072 RepID=A0A1R3RFR3_ASPC5|nr:hypothetical protein ASPCADRAFT_7529 [Aspergillus carbonarius ITEM 5010]